MADRFKRIMHKRVGPGGICCPCCAYGKNRDRQQYYVQFARKEFKRELQNEIDDAYDEDLGGGETRVDGGYA